MVGNHLLALRHRTPRIRGKGAIFRLLDRRLGPFRATTKEGILLPVYSSSLQDEFLIKVDSGQMAEHPLHARIDNLKDGDVFLDVGANIGFYSLLASRKVGKTGLVISLEPSLREFGRFLTTLRWNGATNVMPFKAAASEEPGLVALSVPREHTGRNSIIRRNCGEESIESEVVPTVAIDDLMRCCAPHRRIALCKIDVEGFEMAVLRGMNELLAGQMIRCLCVEVDSVLLENAGSSRSELYNFMQEKHYLPRVQSSSTHFDEVFEAT